MAHDHGPGGHSHDHTAGANAKMLGWALALTSTYLVAEVVGGFVFNSLALLSDAAHMLTDVAAHTPISSHATSPPRRSGSSSSMTPTTSTGWPRSSREPRPRGRSRRPSACRSTASSSSASTDFSRSRTTSSPGSPPTKCASGRAASRTSCPASSRSRPMEPRPPVAGRYCWRPTASAVVRSPGRRSWRR